MDEKNRFALAMRMGRAALGMSQQEFADALGVAKSTVARNETLEMAMRAETLTAMMRVFRDHGIDVDLLGATDSLTITVTAKGLEALENRRMDKGKEK
ncbi:helix-turn-helix domain-containing protein [Chromohalobacter israelensis]|uniref:helix-turn-helix domain-containing protein n=1 Tax=Chromohalobacter israelensis TaxID=141390 RepID=UPI003D78F2FE